MQGRGDCTAVTRSMCVCVRVCPCRLNSSSPIHATAVCCRCVFWANSCAFSFARPFVRCSGRSFFRPFVRPGHRGTRPRLHECRQHVHAEVGEVPARAKEVGPLRFSQERAKPEVGSGRGLRRAADILMHNHNLFEHDCPVDTYTNTRSFTLQCNGACVVRVGPRGVGHPAAEA